MFFGVPLRNSVSGYVGCGVIAVLLPATWYANSQARRKGNRTMICSRCNVLKAADGEPNCNCGGRYLALPEMKWI